ncbi:histone-lysine N-methyltransferase 2D [Calypte anna]|uniref:histone-lysine N-methyltransferase 2D n=1 Tax=Calypte anna TaxID=9244 RepID=UPI0011C3CC81|nr:histone-lysine N-methyltransferase 2D [Calypte anna]
MERNPLAMGAALQDPGVAMAVPDDLEIIEELIKADGFHPDPPLLPPPRGSPKLVPRGSSPLVATRPGLVAQYGPTVLPVPAPTPQLTQSLSTLSLAPKGDPGDKEKMGGGLDPPRFREVLDPPKLGEVLEPPGIRGVLDSPRLREVLDPPKLGEVLDPPRLGGVLDPPELGEVLDPPRIGGVLDPPRIRGVLDPPRFREVLDPPNLGEVLEPPKLGEVLDPPKMREVLDPPGLGGVLDPPRFREVLDPPKLGEVLEPPRIGEVLDNSRLREVLEPPRFGEVLEPPSLRGEVLVPARFGEVLAPPRLVITEQPKQRGMRFRYQCEGRSAGSILGESSTEATKTLPAIELLQCQDIPEVTVTACLVWKDWPHRVHPHGLVGKDCANGLCRVVLKPQTNPKHSFSNLGIQCVKKKEIEAAIERKLQLGIDPFKGGGHPKRGGGP